MNTFMKFKKQKINLENNRNYYIVLTFLCGLIILFSLLSLVLGSASLTLSDVISYFTRETVDYKTVLIMETIRIPRLLGALLVGSSLAVSGFILQIVLNNSLASPSTIGVNAGSALFVVLGASLPLTVHTNVWAFLGSLVVISLVVIISLVTNASRITIILAGISIATICGGLIDLLVIFNPEVVFDKTSFYIGGLNTVSKNDIIYAMPLIVIAYFAILAFKNSFSMLILGEEVAESLGVNVKRTRITAILIVALLTSMSTTIAGLIGFIGIIIPHIVRRIVVGDIKRQLLVTLLFGALFLTAADLIGKTIVSPFEIPVGIILSLVGGPFFIYLLLTTSKRGRFI